MTERATASPSPSEELVSEPTAPKRPRGRPKGTDYRRADAQLHERMRQALQDGVAHSRTAAARLMVGTAYGHGCENSKVRRLVKWYPY